MLYELILAILQPHLHLQLCSDGNSIKGNGNGCIGRDSIILFLKLGTTFQLQPRLKVPCGCRSSTTTTPRCLKRNGKASDIFLQQDITATNSKEAHNSRKEKQTNLFHIPSPARLTLLQAADSKASATTNAMTERLASLPKKTFLRSSELRVIQLSPTFSTKYGNKFLEIDYIP